MGNVAGAVGSVSSRPTKMVASWMADKVAPSYWVPNSKITVSLKQHLSILIRCTLCDYIHACALLNIQPGHSFNFLLTMSSLMCYFIIAPFYEH